MSASCRQGTVVVLALTVAEAEAVNAAVLRMTTEHEAGDMDYLEGRARAAEYAALTRAQTALAHGIAGR